MSRDSYEKNVFGVDPMEHYKHIISELLLKKEDTSSTGVVAQNNVKASQESLPLFSEEIRGLSECDMEILKHVLHDVFTNLNDDVDEIFCYILAISEFRSEKLLSSHARGSCEEEIAPPSAKRKTLTISERGACEELHGHISSDIFEQFTRDIRLIEESGETRPEALQKFSDGLLRKDSSETFFQLSKMAQGVDDLLNTVACNCRSMTTAEKIELGNRIHKLPEKALDHMVEVVKMRKPEIWGSDKVSFNLGRLDDATLWRLYYYVETVLKAKQDLTITPPQVFNRQ